MDKDNFSNNTICVQVSLTILYLTCIHGSMTSNHYPAGDWAIDILQVLLHPFILRRPLGEVMLCAHHHEVNTAIVKTVPGEQKNPTNHVRQTCEVGEGTRPGSYNSFLWDDLLWELIFYLPPNGIAIIRHVKTVIHRDPTFAARISTKSWGPPWVEPLSRGPTGVFWPSRQVILFMVPNTNHIW